MRSVARQVDIVGSGLLGYGAWLVDVWGSGQQGGVTSLRNVAWQIDNVGSGLLGYVAWLVDI